MKPLPAFRSTRGHLLTCACLCVHLSAQAADVYKLDNSLDLNLPGSWEGGVAPTDLDVANWDSFVPAANSTLLGANLAWDGIRVTNPGGAVTIGGAHSLALGASGVNLSGATQNLSLNHAVALAADQIWSSGSGRRITLSGPLSGAFNLTKTGVGELVLGGAGDNSFNNLTIDTSGGVAASTHIFLGKTGGAVAVAAGKTVQFGTGNTGQVNLRMQQSGQFGDGVVMNFGNATGQWSRMDLLGTNQTLAGINTGVLGTQGGGVIQNRALGDTTSLHPLATLTLNGSGTYVYNGHLRDSDSAATAGTNQLRLIKNGSGTQTLAGNVVSHTGGTIINDGKLILGPMVTAGTGTIRGAITVNAPGTLEYAGDNSFGYNANVNATSLTINGATVGGNANFGQHFYQNFALNMTGGSLLLGATNNEFHNATITINASPDIATIARTTGNTTAQMRVRDGLPMTLNVGDGAQPVDLSISAPLVTVTAGSIVTKSGAGTLLLTGAQDNSSTILAATGGTTILDKSGAATIRAAAGISNIAAGATVRIAGTSGDQIYGAGTGNLSRVNMSGGTLDLAGLNEGFDRLEGSGTVSNSVPATTSTLTLGENNGSGVFAGSLNNGAGTLKLVKVGTGTLGLSGSNNLSGSVEVSAGTLALTGSIPSSAASVADGAGLAGEGSVSSLTLGASAGSSLLAEPATAGSLSVTGALEVKGTATVNLASGAFTPGVPFKVIGFGSKAGAWSNANFALANTANYRGLPVFTENANDVSLTLNGANLKWNNAAADLKWNTNLSANFHDGASNSTFFWGDRVLFDDTPGASQAIVIDGAQQPAAMTVNSQYDYTFTSGAAGSLAGGMSLVKAGTGTLSLGTNNTFLGSTTVNGGTLLITGDASLGTAPAAPTPGHLTINGGTLRWNANFNVNGNRGIEMGAGGATFHSVAAGNGGAINVASTIAGSGALSLQANGDTSDTGGGTTGSMLLTSASNSFTGNVTITSGVVAIHSNFGHPANTVVLNGGGLVDQNLNVNFTRNIEVGSAGGVYRTYGSNANSTLAGSVSNAPGVASTILRRTDGGTCWMAGDWSGFTGQFQNKRGNVRISATNANWANVDYIQDTAGGWVEFRGTTSTVNSLASTRDVFVNNGGTLNVDSGAISMSTNGHWWQTNAGDLGKLTSSSGTLTMTNGAASGALATLDHKINLRLVDFNGSTPLTFVKNGVNQLPLNQANTHTGGTTVNAGRIHTDNIQALGLGPVTVNNGGQVFLSGAGTYANNFTITGPGQSEAAGTLGAIRFVNNTVSGNVTVAAGGSRITAHGGFGNHTGSLLGSGNLEINSTASGNNGTITLGGNSPSYTGIITVSQGRLNVNGASYGGGLVSPDNTTLGGEATFAGNVTLGSTAGNALVIDAGTPAKLTANGTLTVNGTVTVTPTGVLPGGTPIPVVGFTSKGGLWNQANFALAGAANYRPGAGFTETANAIELTVPAADLVWNNSVANSIWNTNVDANFQDSVPSNQAFFWGDRVTFNDVPGAVQTITVSGTVQPATMTVDSQYDYVFNGGTIAGGSVLKRGTGTLALNQANTFTGGLTVSQGHVRLGSTGGASTLATVNDASTGAADTSLVAAAALNGINTNVVVTNQGTGAVTLGSVSGQTGLVVYNGTFNLGRAVTINGSSDRTTLTGKISGNVGTIRIAGATGHRTTIANGTNDFTGDVVISDGVLYQNDSPTALPVTTDVTGEGTAQFRLNNGSIHTIDALNGTGSTYIVAGGVTTLSLGNGNGNGSYAGTVLDSAAQLSLAKNGTGTQQLTGSNTYTGTTTVNGGTLLANNSTGSGTGTGAVSVNTGGKLGGTGAITGAVTVNTGGTLAPGASIESLATGALTLNAGSSFAVEYDSSGVPTVDVLNVTGNVTLAGSLNLADLAAVPVALPLGTKLTIMTYTGTLAGNFAGIAEGGGIVSGPNTFKVRYADGGNVVTLEASDVVAPPYDSWASSKGLNGTNNGKDMDPDKDGVNNLLEFYLDGNPLASDGSILPQISLTATHMVITLNRRDDAEAQLGTELAQWGLNLSAWNDVALGATSSGPNGNGVLVQVAENGAAPDTITVSIPRTLSVGGKLFGRVKVTE